MGSFTDSSGKNRAFQLTIGIAKRIKAKTGIDLLEGDPGLVASTIYEKPVARIDMMYEMLIGRDQTSQDDFEEGLGPDALTGATDALWLVVRNFIQSLRPERAEAISQMVEVTKKASRKQTEAIVRMATDPQSSETPRERDTEGGERSVRSLWRAIYQLAGCIGISVENLTLRELFWVSEGRLGQPQNEKSLKERWEEQVAARRKRKQGL